MTGKKMSRRKLFKLLPSGVLAALAGLSTAIAAGDEVETIQVELGIDSAQLPQPVWDIPLETVIDTGSGTIADNIDCVDYGILWDHVEGEVKTSVGFTVEGEIADNCTYSLVIE